jgi:N-acetylmuramoyl-L-alanine amidase
MREKLYPFKGLIGFALAVLCFFCKADLCAQNEFKALVKQVEFSEKNNLEIEISGKTEFKAFILKNPDRLVIDVKNGAMESTLNPAIPHFVSSSRQGLQKDFLRLVFDLKQPLGIVKSSFQKIKNQNFGKIIVELDGIKKPAEIPEKIPEKIPQAKIVNIDAAKIKPATKSSSKNISVKTEQVINPDGTTTYIIKKITPDAKIVSLANYSLTKDKKPATQKITTRRIPVIVIDAGHGGKDPGTIGDFARTKEKNITLAYAKELKKSLENSKNYKVFLTRDDDFFVSLRKRVEKSRRLNADLFISIHANSIGDNQTSGFSIYTLSQKSSDKQAELLAQKENRADIITSVNFSGASPDVMKTLIDLSQRDSMNSSSRFANIVIRSVKKSEIKILQNSHRFAGFAVLTIVVLTGSLQLSEIVNAQQNGRWIFKGHIPAVIAFVFIANH